MTLSHSVVLCFICIVSRIILTHAGDFISTQNGDFENKILNCTADEPCIVSCEHSTSCRQTRINCASGQPCNVTCSANDACTRSIIYAQSSSSFYLLDCASGQWTCVGMSLYFPPNDYGIPKAFVIGADRSFGVGNSGDPLQFYALYGWKDVNIMLGSGFTNYGFHGGVMHCALDYLRACNFSATAFTCDDSNHICNDPPTESPTMPPTLSSIDPTTDPTISPTRNPTYNPSFTPTTALPTDANPTASPSYSPSQIPTTPPSYHPSLTPTTTPTYDTAQPSTSPSKHPSEAPIVSPTTNVPTISPTTTNPSESPSKMPTISPTTTTPSQSPSKIPTISPTLIPTVSPTTSSVSPTALTVPPTNMPSSKMPTISPTLIPTVSPTTLSESPTTLTVPPTNMPSNKMPTTSPTLIPTVSPTTPTVSPTTTTVQPTNTPSSNPTQNPTNTPQYWICDDECNTSTDNDNKMQIQVTFSFSEDILYTLNNMECFLNQMFAVLFEQYQFVDSLTVCDIEIDDVSGGNPHNEETVCEFVPCFSSVDVESNQNRRALLQENQSSSTITIIPYNLNTYSIINSLSRNSMQTHFENAFMDAFGISVEVTITVMDGNELDETTNTTTTSAFNPLWYVITGLVALLCIIAVLLLWYMMRSHKMQRKLTRQQSENFTITAGDEQEGDALKTHEDGVFALPQTLSTALTQRIPTDSFIDPPPFSPVASPPNTTPLPIILVGGKPIHMHSYGVYTQKALRDDYKATASSAPSKWHNTMSSVEMVVQNPLFVGHNQDEQKVNETQSRSARSIPRSDSNVVSISRMKSDTNVTSPNINPSHFQKQYNQNVAPISASMPAAQPWMQYPPTMNWDYSQTQHTTNVPSNNVIHQNQEQLRNYYAQQQMVAQQQQMYQQQRMAQQQMYQDTRRHSDGIQNRQQHNIEQQYVQYQQMQHHNMPPPARVEYKSGSSEEDSGSNESSSDGVKHLKVIIMDPEAANVMNDDDMLEQMSPMLEFQKIEPQTSHNTQASTGTMVHHQNDSSTITPWISPEESTRTIVFHPNESSMVSASKPSLNDFLPNSGQLDILMDEDDAKESQLRVPRDSKHFKRENTEDFHRKLTQVAMGNDALMDDVLNDMVKLVSKK